MKIRTGFVSNSSSSSFIAIVPEHINNCECCQKILKSVYKLKKAKDIIVEDYYYDSVEEFLSQYNEDQHSMLLDAVRKDLEVLIASPEYGQEDLYINIAEALGLDYEVE